MASSVGHSSIQVHWDYIYLYINRKNNHQRHRKSEPVFSNNHKLFKNTSSDIVLTFFTAPRTFNCVIFGLCVFLGTFTNTGKTMSNITTHNNNNKIIIIIIIKLIPDGDT